MIQIHNEKNPQPTVAAWSADPGSFRLEVLKRESLHAYPVSSQNSPCSRGVVLRLEELLETLQDRRRTTDQMFRLQLQRPGGKLCRVGSGLHDVLTSFSHVDLVFFSCFSLRSRHQRPVSTCSVDSVDGPEDTILHSE